LIILKVGVGKMRGTFGLIVCGLCVAVISWIIFFDRAPSIEGKPKTASLIEALSVEEASAAPVNLESFGSSADQTTDPVSNTHRHYQGALFQLAGAIDQHGLDAESLIDRAIAEPRADFLESLPDDIQFHFQEVYRVADEMAQHYLEQDGMHSFDLSAHFVEEPLWIQARKQELAGLELSKEIQMFVDQISEAQEIRDEDVLEIISLCRGQTDCVDKSVQQWIDSNHLLTEGQFDLIEGEQ